MSAQIVIDDGVTPTIGSVDKDNTFVGTTFDISNADDTNVLAWDWDLADKPIGSSATLTNPTPATAQITPDVPGSYLIRLKTYLDAGATALDDADEQVIGVRFETPFDWRIPAAGETTQLDASRGWATAREESIRDVQSFMNSGVPALWGVVNEALDGADPETVLGGFVFAGGALPALAAQFRLVGALTVASSGTGVLRLYDLGPAAGPPAAPVLRATATIPNLSAGSVVVIDTALTAVASPGVNLGQVHTSRRLYELRAQLVGGAGGDTLKVHTGGIVLEG